MKRSGRWLLLGRLHIGWLRFWRWPTHHYSPPMWQLGGTHFWGLGPIGVRWCEPEPIRFPERPTANSLGWSAEFPISNAGRRALDEADLQAIEKWYVTVAGVFPERRLSDG